MRTRTPNTGQPSSAAVGIAAVERDTGLSKDTLRVWERRYGFPAPGRDAFGERSYPRDQVERLRALKRLLDLGHRPGKIVGLPIVEVQRLIESSGSAANGRLRQPQFDDDLDGLLDLLNTHRIDELRGRLSQLLLRTGLAGFIVEVVAPLNERVGDAWMRGSLQIFEEHLYTEVIGGLLRNAILSVPRSDTRPRALFTTFPQEPHGLGILMAEAMFALEGGHCVSLGVQTPLGEIALAAQAHRADIVAVSFSAAVNAHQAAEGLAELRAALPTAVQLWVGGNLPALHRRPPHGVQTLRSLDEIAPALARWRQAHAPP